LWESNGNNSPSTSFRSKLAHSVTGVLQHTPLMNGNYTNRKRLTDTVSAHKAVSRRRNVGSAS